MMKGIEFVRLLAIISTARSYDTTVSSWTSGYDSSARPGLNTLGVCAPTQVRVGMYVEKIHTIDQKRQSYDLDCYFRSWWRDHRHADRS